MVVMSLATEPQGAADTRSARARRLAVAMLSIVLVAGLVSGCAATSTTTATTGDPGSATPADHGKLPVSHASANVVQSQPAPGSCHASGSGLYSEPDPRCTPGALNPAVTQATIKQTICVKGYTSRVRPPENVTHDEKRASMAAYGDNGPVGSYEYDHLVPLGVGGAVNDPRNLWPEPGASPNPKDDVEDDLHQMVCDGKMSLSHAQQIAATGWVAWAKQHGIH
jgi:hypothetical protein